MAAQYTDSSNNNIHIQNVVDVFVYCCVENENSKCINILRNPLSLTNLIIADQCVSKQSPTVLHIAVEFGMAIPAILG